MLIIALLLGLFAPFFGKTLNPYVLFLLTIVLFLAYLKVDFFEIITHIKKPIFISYIIFLYLILIPALTFLIFRLINIELAVAFLLLTSVPPGMAAPALTDFVKGNTSLSIAISVVAYIISPFTVVFLMYLFTGKILQLDLVSLFKTLAIFSFFPLIVAQICRKLFFKIVQKTKHLYSGFSVLLISFLVYIVVANQSAQILAHPFAIIPYVAWLYLLFILLHIAGYLVGFWRKKEDKVALSVTKTYMNIALAIVLGLSFFTPNIALILVLSEIPWSTTLGGFRHIIKYLD